MTSASARQVTIRGQRFRLDLNESTSKRLAQIRRASTRPEAAVRRALRSLDLHFRTVNRGLPGSPDFANRGRRWAVFVHGCYWHHHRGCRRATIPATNQAFWLAKFEDNRRRDQRVTRALRRMGFAVVVIWECSTSKPATLRRQLLRLCRGRNDEQ